MIKERSFSATLGSIAVSGLLAVVLAGYFQTVSAQTRSQPEKTPRKRAERRTSDKDAKKDQEAKTGLQESLFLQEGEKMIDYVPDIYRCPECGYEQDEPGTCPDHNTLDLVKVISKGRDPLEPAEFDGNEDIIVDVPLKNLLFKKEVEPVATGSEQMK